MAPRIRLLLLLIATHCTAASTANATALQAAPVLIEMQSAVPTSNVSVRNIGKTSFDVQTRIYRWTQVGGKDILEETDDVVTSPPVVTLNPSANYSVRIVRTNGQPVEKEEAYRLLVDQLPDEDKIRGGTVALVMRHSIPVFALPESSSSPKLRWFVKSQNGQLVLQVQNDGQRRVRLSGVKVQLSDGRVVNFGSGLLGYVLAGSSMSWHAASPGGSGGNQNAKVTATSDIGTIDAVAKVGH